MSFPQICAQMHKEELATETACIRKDMPKSHGGGVNIRSELNNAQCILYIIK